MKLSKREQVLTIAVGGVVVVLLNMMLISAFARQNIVLRVALDQRKTEWSAMQALLGEDDMWKKRDDALTAKQPKLVNENAAGPELLDEIQMMARKHNVTLDNEVVGGVAKNVAYRSVPVEMDAHCSWPALIEFLYALQKPDQFLVCEDANIQVDAGDQTKMLAHLKIARWYAP